MKRKFCIEHIQTHKIAEIDISIMKVLVDLSTFTWENFLSMGKFPDSLGFGLLNLYWDWNEIK